MRTYLTQKSLTEEPALLENFLTILKEDTPFFKASYPEFDKWISQKVIPGIYEGNRTVVIDRRSDFVSGLLILKHTTEEKKICTLRVRPQHESHGLGVRLFELAFELLETDKPLLSVSDISKQKFLRIFQYFGFSHKATYRGLYIPSREEHSFNGFLKTNAIWNDQHSYAIPQTIGLSERTAGTRHQG